MKTEILKKAIDKIKELGYQVYVPNDDGPRTYAHYSDGTNVGYIQVEDFERGINISTIHKANRDSGTGYQIFGGDDAIDPENLTTHELNMGFISQPNWARSKPPEKFTLDQWLKTEWSGKRAIQV